MTSPNLPVYLFETPGEAEQATGFHTFGDGFGYRGDRDAFPASLNVARKLAPCLLRS